MNIAAEVEIMRAAGLDDLLKKSPAYAVQYQAVVQDIKNLSTSDLKSKYEHEYSSWANRKHWAKANGVQWADSMSTFSGFLLTCGPIPEPSWTLDRIDPTGHYVPPNLRWASKVTQSQNRTTTITVLFRGEQCTLSHVAQLTGHSYDAVRMGYSRHGAEYVNGLANALREKELNSAEANWAFPEQYHAELEEMYAARSDLNQLRPWFFIELARSHHSEIGQQLSRTNDAIRKAELEAEMAEIKLLHDETVYFLKLQEVMRDHQRLIGPHYVGTSQRDDDYSQEDPPYEFN